MARRTERMAEDAAMEAALASEAGRVLQARAHATERAEPEPEPEGDRRPVKAFNKPRESAFAEIEAREEREMEKAPPQEPEFEPEPAKPEVKADTPEPAPEPAPEAAPVPVEAPPELVKVKVDGEEFEVPKADIEAAGGIHAYQRDRATDNRLKKANELIAENRKMQEALLQQAMRQLQPQAPQVPPQTAAIQKLAAARFGSDEEYAAAMQEFMALQAPKAQDENILVTKATISMKHENAVAKFRQDFPEIVNNPMLNELFGTQFQKRLSTFVVNGQTDWQKLSAFDFQSEFANIGNQIKSLIAPRPSQPPTQAVAQDAPSPTPDREARKASIVNLPTASVRATPPAEEKVLSPEEQRKSDLAELARARGKHVG